MINCHQMRMALDHPSRLHSVHLEWRKLRYVQMKLYSAIFDMYITKATSSKISSEENAFYQNLKCPQK